MIYPCFKAVVILEIYMAVLNATLLTYSAPKAFRKFNTSLYFYAHFQNQYPHQSYIYIYDITLL